MTQAFEAGITVAGTKYVPATIMTFQRYGYLMGQIWSLDLSSVTSDRAMLARVFEQGQGGTLLAACLVPEVDGVAEPWTPAVARRTAALIDRLADINTMNALLPFIVEVLADFFRGGVDSSEISETSSTPSTMTPASISEAQKSERLGGTHSASSASSSELSPATT